MSNLNSQYMTRFSSLKYPCMCVCVLTHSCTQTYQSKDHIFDLLLIIKLVTRQTGAHEGVKVKCIHDIILPILYVFLVSSIKSLKILTHWEYLASFVVESPKNSVWPLFQLSLLLPSILSTYLNLWFFIVTLTSCLLSWVVWPPGLILLLSIGFLEWERKDQKVMWPKQDLISNFLIAPKRSPF